MSFSIQSSSSSLYQQNLQPDYISKTQKQTNWKVSQKRETCFLYLWKQNHIDIPAFLLYRYYLLHNPSFILLILAIYLTIEILLYIIHTVCTCLWKCISFYFQIFAIKLYSLELQIVFKVAQFSNHTIKCSMC